MRWSRQEQVFKVFFLSILTILVLVGIHVCFFATSPKLGATSEGILGELSSQSFFTLLRTAPEQTILKNINLKIPFSKHLTSKCGMNTCFDIYRCGKLGENKLSVYVYPVEKIVVNGKVLQDSLSTEFYEIIAAILRSPHFVTDPTQACIFVPTIDLLNLQPFLAASSSQSNMTDVSRALQNLKFWGEDGANHLLFTMFPGSDPLTSISKAAIVAAAGFSVETYRKGFHIPIISYNPAGSYYNSKEIHLNHSHPLSSPNNITGFCVSAQGLLPDSFSPKDVLVLDFCRHDPLNYSLRCKGDIIYKYPDVLKFADYCLVVGNLSHLILWDIMSVGCVPVIVRHHQRLPLDELIDWKRNAIILYEHQLPEIGSILRRVSASRKKKMQAQVNFIFNNYFITMEHVTRTVMRTVSERVFSHTGRTIFDWNSNPENGLQISPIFNPVIVPKTPGFTAVILAYDRIPSLFEVISRVALVPSLSKILIVWNNNVKKPPPAEMWPRISKPFKIVQTRRNQMSNRFYPYDEIETEAVFSLDDDIIMLTVDEIEFGFEAWREYADRVVGFPSRSHVWDNTTKRWKYESEWTNEISMVLTGAAFYHKYWHYAYTYEMSATIREYVDQRMNCEDIAMNFLIANTTGKAPIKVTPRKKFKCPTCPTNEMLSADTGHMVERTDCINKFTEVYGCMPLIPVEFRADPVLFKVDSLPSKLKRFKDIGNL